MNMLGIRNCISGEMKKLISCYRANINFDLLVRLAFKCLVGENTENWGW